MGYTSLVLPIFLLSARANDAARILGIFHVPSKSHHILGSKLLTSLAERGHEVTMISPYPFKEQITNYRDIPLEEALRFKDDDLQTMLSPNRSLLERIPISLTMFSKLADIVLSNSDVQKLKQEKFDLIIQYGLSSESLLGLAHHFRVPVILLNTLGSLPPIDKITGNVSPPAYTPNPSLSITGKMIFIQRVFNTLATWAYYGLLSGILENQQEEVLRKYFPEAPTIQELTDYVALVFLNSHYSIETPRPHVPNMIQIGGFHIDDPKELPVDLQKFLDEATEGAIFFSLGSNIKISSLPPDKVQAIITALGKLKMKVLFKAEEDLADLPSNIKTGKWLPQNDILGHPNVKVFITHGGLLSTTESVYHAVPFIAIPIFGDQQSNAAIASGNGYGILVDLNELTTDTFLNVINEIITNPKYRDNVQLRSSLIRDQPVKPLQSAIFWVEHVLKYKGADHLKVPGAKLHLYQYLLIDVILFLVVILLIVIFMLYFIFSKLIKLIKSAVRRIKRKVD